MPLIVLARIYCTVISISTIYAQGNEISEITCKVDWYDYSEGGIRKTEVSESDFFSPEVFSVPETFPIHSHSLSHAGAFAAASADPYTATLTGSVSTIDYANRYDRDWSTGYFEVFLRGTLVFLNENADHTTEVDIPFSVSLTENTPNSVFGGWVDSISWFQGGNTKVRILPGETQSSFRMRGREMTRNISLQLYGYTGLPQHDLPSMIQTATMKFEFGEMPDGVQFRTVSPVFLREDDLDIEYFGPDSSVVLRDNNQDSVSPIAIEPNLEDLKNLTNNVKASSSYPDGLRGGLIADGVTPLIVRIAKYLVEEEEEYEISFDDNNDESLLGRPLLDRVKVLNIEQGRFVYSNRVKLKPEHPYGFILIEPIKAEELQLQYPFGSYYSSYDGPPPWNVNTSTWLTYRALKTRLKFEKIGGSPFVHEHYRAFNTTERDLWFSKPPIALVHGYNASSSSWSDDFLQRLKADRGESMIFPINYGVKSGIPEIRIESERKDLEEKLKDYDPLDYCEFRDTPQTARYVCDGPFQDHTLNLIAFRKNGNVDAVLDYVISKRNINENRDTSIRHNAMLLDDVLKDTFENEDSIFRARKDWAFTRYDVAGHSQGGVLLRALSAEDNLYSSSPYRSKSNYYRGRFRRAITIGSPHNGSLFLAWINALKTSRNDPISFELVSHYMVPELLELNGVLQDKFDPFGFEIPALNEVKIDPLAKFHLIQANTVGTQQVTDSDYTGLHYKLTALNVPTLKSRNPEIREVFKVPRNQVYPVLPSDFFDTAAEVLFPYGSDAVVGLPSQGGGPGNMRTFFEDHSIAHSDPHQLFGVPEGNTETAHRGVANLVLGLLNGPEYLFGSFKNPESFHSYDYHHLVELVPDYYFLNLAISVAQKTFQSSYTDSVENFDNFNQTIVTKETTKEVAAFENQFELHSSVELDEVEMEEYEVQIPGSHVLPEDAIVNWLAGRGNEFGSSEGIEIIPTPGVSGKAIVRISNDVVDSVWGVVAYTNKEGVTVFPRFKIRDRTTEIVGLEIESREIILTKGQSSLLSVNGITEDGDFQRLDVESDFLIFNSSDDTIASVDVQGRITALKAGSAIIEVISGDFSASVLVTVSDTSVDLEEKTLSSAESEYSLEITSTESWSISHVPDWVSLSKSSGFGDELIQVFVNSNLSPDGRMARLKVNNAHHFLRQEGKTPNVTIDTPFIDFGMNAHTFELSISSNETWVVTEEIEWLNVDAASGGSNDTVKITVEKNETGKSRFGELLIGDAIVSVIQSGVQTMPKLSIPSFGTPGGNYEIPITISLNSNDDGAEIRYTLDGTEPNKSSILYVSPFTLEVGIHQIIAKSFKDGSIESDRIEEVYKIEAPKFPLAPAPKILRPPGSFEGFLEIGISSADPNLIIRYTLDGSDPDESSPKYFLPIYIGNGSHTLKARGFKDNHEPSEVIEENFEIATETEATAYPAPRKDGRAIGEKSFLVIRMKFADTPEEPPTIEELEQSMTHADNVLRDYSQGMFSMKWDITSDVINSTDNTPTDVHTMFTGGTMEEVIDLAEKLGNHISNYDFAILATPRLSNLGNAWASFPFRTMLIGNSTTVHYPAERGGVFVHEIGHLLGLNHSSAWVSSTSDPFGSGYSLEYGERDDAMGISYNSHFNALSKYHLGWLGDGDVERVSTGGLFRVYRHDHPEADALRLLEIGPENGSPYYLDYRYLQSESSNLVVGERGAGIRIIESGRSALLDAFPNSAPVSEFGSDIDDYVDFAFPVGSSLNDYEQGIRVNVIDSGGVEPNQFIDVEIVFGDHSLSPPVILNQPQPTEVIKGDSSGILKVVAIGSNLTYQWYRVEDSGQSTPVSESNSASFNIPQLSQNTIFWAEIKNDIETIKTIEVEVIVEQTDLPVHWIKRFNTRVLRGYDSQAAFTKDGKGFFVAEKSIICIDIETGELIWSYEDDKWEPYYSPTLGESGLFVGHHFGTMLALNPDTGDVLWEAQSGGSAVYGSVLIEDLIVFSAAHNVTALNMESGEERWQITHAPGQRLSRVVSDSNGYIYWYVDNADPSIVCRKGKTGELVWERKFTDSLRSSSDISLSRGIVLANLRESGFEKIIALDSSSGNTVWEYVFGDKHYSSNGYNTPILVRHNGQIITISSDGFIYALDPLTGTLDWTHPLPSVGDLVDRFLLGGEDKMYLMIYNFSSQEYRVGEFDFSTRAFTNDWLISKNRPPSNVRSPSMSPGGKLLFSMPNYDDEYPSSIYCIQTDIEFSDRNLWGSLNGGLPADGELGGIATDTRTSDAKIIIDIIEGEQMEVNLAKGDEAFYYYYLEASRDLTNWEFVDGPLDLNKTDSQFNFMNDMDEGESIFYRIKRSDYLLED